MVAAAIGIAGPSNAAEILCQNANNNHMLVDSSYVSACLDAGVGNLTGNPANDPFLIGVGSAYTFVEESGWSQTGDTGTFSFDQSLWDTYSDIAIGFKFGTGNQPDEWFVFSLNDLVSSGLWTFVNVFDRGGGLSHVNLYSATGGTSIPEPATLALLGVALAGLGFARRRKLH